MVRKWWSFRETQVLGTNLDITRVCLLYQDTRYQFGTQLFHIAILIETRVKFQSIFLFQILRMSINTNKLQCLVSENLLLIIVAVYISMLM